MENYYILISCFAVSVDAFLVGLALAARKIKLSLKDAFIIALSPLVLSFLSTRLGNLAADFISQKTANVIGAIFLMLLAANIFFVADKKDTQINTSNFILVFFAGLTVAIDASSIAFSLGLSMASPLIVAVYCFVFHLVLAYLGNRISYTALQKNIGAGCRYMSAGIFLFLSVLRLI